jgi:N-acetylmuramic acid 6-phosphate etherase
MSTEKISAKYADIDLWPTARAVGAMAEGQVEAAAAVQAETDAIARAADAAAERLRDGKGRLIYIGAGTSGRIAVQDGVELVPTFNWDPDRLLYLLAGGSEALLASIEGAEDDDAAAEQAIGRSDPSPADVTIGVAASGRTPYTVAAIRAAARAGALTVGIANNAATPLLEAAAHPILLDTGPEIVAGSTRMKAGTAQKIALNLFSTALMLRLGRVYRGLMVDMRTSNRKLRHRAVQMVVEISGVDLRAAEAAFEQAGGDIKLASLIALGADPDRGAEALREAGGNLRLGIEKIRSTGRA